MSIQQYQVLEIKSEASDLKKITITISYEMILPTNKRMRTKWKYSKNSNFF